MYKIKKLEYDFNSLMPYISENTILKHYKHYENQVEKLNQLLPNTNYTLIELFNNIDKYPIDIRDEIIFLASSILNHELYFDIINPNREKMSGKLIDDIIKEYGNFDNFKNEFVRQANLMVGSGYTFLVLNKQKKLEIVNFSNEDNPYMYGLIPIMNIDLWEHAYYLDYGFDKNEYIKSFFEIVDFTKVNDIYEKNI